MLTAKSFRRLRGTIKDCNHCYQISLHVILLCLTLEHSLYAWSLVTDDAYTGGGSCLSLERISHPSTEKNLEYFCSSLFSTNITLPVEGLNLRVCYKKCGSSDVGIALKFKSRKTQYFSLPTSDVWITKDILIKNISETVAAMMLYTKPCLTDKVTAGHVMLKIGSISLAPPSFTLSKGRCSLTKGSYDRSSNLLKCKCLFDGHGVSFATYETYGVAQWHIYGVESSDHWQWIGVACSTTYYVPTATWKQFKIIAVDSLGVCFNEGSLVVALS